jgi:uncharacterized protein (DUF2336 family)
MGRSNRSGGDRSGHSSRLATSTLAEIARTKGRDYLLAISGRSDLPEAVTDVIVDRGERNLIRNLASDASAYFSGNRLSRRVRARRTR